MFLVELTAYPVSRKGRASHKVCSSVLFIPNPGGRDLLDVFLSQMSCRRVTSECGQLCSAKTRRNKMNKTDGKVPIQASEGVGAYGFGRFVKVVVK